MGAQRNPPNLSVLPIPSRILEKCLTSRPLRASATLHSRPFSRAGRRPMKTFSFFIGCHVLVFPVRCFLYLPAFARVPVAGPRQGRRGGIQPPPQATLVAVMLSGMRKSVQTELDGFFAHLEQQAQLVRHVSEQAFAAVQRPQ